MDITLIGVPFNSDGTQGGVARLPAVLRAHGLAAALRGAGSAVVDDGDVAFAAPRPERDPISAIVAVDAVAEIATQLRQGVARALRRGRFPLVIAGECSALLGALAAVRDVRGGAGLLFVDGHEDAWPPQASPTGEISDMELGLALGSEREGLPPQLRELLPLLAPDELVVLGPRDRLELEAAAVASLRDGLFFVADAELRAALPAGVARAVAHLDRAGSAWWLHVDLDVLSSAALPAVDYPQPGGLGWEDLAELTALALAGKRLVGMDVTIYNPDLDPGEGQAERIVAYLADALGDAGPPRAKARDQ